MRYENGETVRILYEAKALTTGLTDVKITIWGPVGTKLVNAAAMTELSDGLYYYDYTIPSVGNFISQCNSATLPRYVNDKFLAVAAGGAGVTIADIWNANLNDYKKSGTMGKMMKHGGGLYQSSVKGGLTEKDKEEFIKGLNKIFDQQKDFEKTLNNVQKRMDELDQIIKTTNDNIDMNTNKIENSFIDKHDISDSKTNETTLKIASLCDEITNLKDKDTIIEGIIKELNEEKAVKELHQKVDNFKTNMIDLDNSIKNINNDVNAKMGEL